MSESNQPTNQQNPILAFFEYDHLPEHLQDVSRGIAEIAKEMDSNLKPCAELNAGLCKLLEAKDCFVRAKVSST